MLYTSHLSTNRATNILIFVYLSSMSVFSLSQTI